METRTKAIDSIIDLFEVPLIYYLITGAIAIILFVTTKKAMLSVLTAYLFFILAITVLIRRPTGTAHYKLSLFWSYRVWDKQHDQILANIFMFIPVGLLFHRPRGILLAFIFSVTIETIQLLTHTGLFEFDDMINNAFGALLGVLLYTGIKKIIQSKNGTDYHHSEIEE